MSSGFRLFPQSLIHISIKYIGRKYKLIEDMKIIDMPNIKNGCLFPIFMACFIGYVANVTLGEDNIEFRFYITSFFVSEIIIHWFSSNENSRVMFIQSMFCILNALLPVTILYICHWGWQHVQKVKIDLIYYKFRLFLCFEVDLHRDWR